MAKEGGDSHRQKSTSRQICSVCDNAGYEHVVGGVVRCNCRLELVKTIKLSKIPERYCAESIETFRKTPVKICEPGKEVFLNAFFPKDFDIRKNYFFAGRGGEGKTHLLWSQYRFSVENSIPVYAEHEYEIYKKLREEQYSDIWYFYLTGRTHFFIDDIACRNATEDRSSNLFGLIDSLYEKKAGLTITCNHKLSAVSDSEMLGQNTNRIIRRIKDMCTVVYF